MMTRVRSVISSARASGLTVRVGSSMSQNTTSAPVAVIAWWAAT
jgi:hypothetical protein